MYNIIVKIKRKEHIKIKICKSLYTLGDTGNTQIYDEYLPKEKIENSNSIIV
jgi:hypothetical protein